MSEATPRAMHANPIARTVERPPGRELENDPGDNPCFGCGPDNVDGLRLKFFDDGEVVRAPFELDARFSSWHNFANAGIVLTAMMETGGWAVWERFGPSRLVGPMTVVQEMPIALGPLLLEARLDIASDNARIDVVALQGAKEVMCASWNARRARPDEAKALLAFPDIPRSLKPAFEERAAGRA